MDWVMSGGPLHILAVLFSFGLIVLVHEFGHFIAAKKTGVTVYEFCLGFGPRLFMRKYGDTEYALRAIPLGGFVRLEGEDQVSEDPNDPNSFQNKTTGQKLLVILGGCFMNYLSAFIVFMIVGMVAGIGEIQKLAVVGSVVEGKPAAVAGLKTGDRIEAVNGTTVTTWNQMTDIIRANPGTPVALKVRRADQELNLTITPDPVEAEKDGQKIKVGQIGIAQGTIMTIQFVPAESAGDVASRFWTQAYRVTVAPVMIIKSLTNKEIGFKEVKEGSGSPLMIMQMLYEASRMGFWELCFLWTIINTLVGAFNLLPVPALDGARAVFIAIGAVLRRPIDPNKEAMVHSVGLMVLMALVLLLAIQDVGRMSQGGGIFGR